MIAVALDAVTERPHQGQADRVHDGRAGIRDDRLAEEQFAAQERYRERHHSLGERVSSVVSKDWVLSVVHPPGLEPGTH